MSNTRFHQDAGLAAARQTLPLQLNGKVGLPPKSLIVVTCGVVKCELLTIAVDFGATMTD